MGQPTTYWPSESVRLFLFYLAVGAAFVPSGLLYGLLSVAGIDHWLVATPLLGTGFLMAALTWKHLEKRYHVNSTQIVSEKSTTTPSAALELSKEITQSGMEIRNENLNRSVEELELSVRLYNFLKNANIQTIGELIQKSEQEILRTKNFSRESLSEIKEILTSMGLSLGMKVDESKEIVAPTRKEDLNYKPQERKREMGHDIPKGAVAHIGKSVLVRGELSGSEDLYIDGQVEGTIELREHNLSVGPNGRVEANINAKEVVILGTVKGTVRTADRIEIRKSGSLVGDCVAARVIIEDGAYFKGSIDIQKTGEIAPKWAEPKKAEDLRLEDRLTRVADVTGPTKRLR